MVYLLCCECLFETTESAANAAIVDIAAHLDPQPADQFGSDIKLDREGAAIPGGEVFLDGLLCCVVQAAGRLDPRSATALVNFNQVQKMVQDTHVATRFTCDHGLNGLLDAFFLKLA